MSPKKSFKQLPFAARLGIIGAGILELTLLLVTLNDLRKRPAALVRGSKKGWRIVSFINFFGPVSYFAFGRRKQL